MNTLCLLSAYAAVWISLAVMAIGITSGYTTRAGLQTGMIVRLGSFWVGAHYSEYNRRWCINYLPCVTVWVVLPGGTVPGDHK